VASTVQDLIGLLRDSLKEQFQRGTDQLVELAVRRQQGGRGGYDHDTLTALIASAGQAVSDTAQALRRMAERSTALANGARPTLRCNDWRSAACPVLRAMPAQANRLIPRTSTTSATA
jgi:hypothetical protein